MRRPDPRRLSAVGITLALGVCSSFVNPPAFAAKGTKVPCRGSGGGESGLKAAVASANRRGSQSIFLEPGCVYNLTSADNTGANGPNGLPLIQGKLLISRDTDKPNGED